MKQAQWGRCEAGTVGGGGGGHRSSSVLSRILSKSCKVPKWGMHHVGTVSLNHFIWMGKSFSYSGRSFLIFVVNFFTLLHER